MRLPDGFRHLDGHYWCTVDEVSDRIIVDYIRSVMNSNLDETEFWIILSDDDRTLDTSKARSLIEAGGIRPTPTKPAPQTFETGSWHWIQIGLGWTVARAMDLNGLCFETIDDEDPVMYRDVIEVGPGIEEHRDEEGAHEPDDCPLCLSREQLAEMRARNQAADAAKRTALLVEIDADPSAFVHVVEGYEDGDDRSPIVMFVGSSADRVRERLRSYRSSDGNIFEVTPNRIDGERTGEVVTFHLINRGGVLVEGEGRHYPEDQSA